MLVATKVKLSMERLARLNGTYGGKGSESSKRWAESSIDRSRVNTGSVRVSRYISLLRRHVAIASFLG